MSEWKEGKGKECEGERVRNIYGIFNVAREIFIRDVCASFSLSLVDGRKMCELRTKRWKEREERGNEIR